MDPQTKKSGGNPLLFWRRSSASEAEEEATPSEPAEEAAPEEATPLAGGNAHGGALDDVDDLMAKLAEQQVSDSPVQFLILRVYMCVTREIDLG